MKALRRASATESPQGNDCSLAIRQFFEPSPLALRLYETLMARVQESIAQVSVRVHKSQISLVGDKSFACVWLPIRKIRNRPAVYIIVTFGLRHRLESPRIVESVEPRPGRWTHHVIINHLDEIDEELLGWLRLAYTSAHQKQGPL